MTEQELKEANEQANSIYDEITRYVKEPEDDCPLTPIDDDHPDVDQWNRKLNDWIRTHDEVPRYMNTPFLLTECYMYRRLMSPFFKSKYFKAYDVFENTKRNGFIRSRSISTSLVEYAAGISDRIKANKTTCEEEFEIFLHFALWGKQILSGLVIDYESSIHFDKLNSYLLKSVGNHFDLSGLIGERVLTNFKLVDNKKKSKIISDSTKELYEYFKSSSTKQHQITFVLDNAGFELLGDLCFIEMLYQTGLLDENSKVVFHCKLYAWFVSDVIDNDFTWLLNCMQTEFESDVVKQVARRWSNLLSNQNWQLKTHGFWTTCYKFGEMKQLAPDLYDELSKSDLVFFCGDLNYRKLIK